MDDKDRALLIEARRAGADVIWFNLALIVGMLTPITLMMLGFDSELQLMGLMVPYVTFLGFATHQMVAARKLALALDDQLKAAGLDAARPPAKDAEAAGDADGAPEAEA